MAVHTIIKKGQLEGNSSLDAEYYQPKYLKLKQALQSTGGILVKEVATVKYGYMPQADYVNSEEGIPIVRVTNIQDKLEISLDELKYVPKSSKIKEEHFLRDSDVLLVQCGSTTGKIGYFSQVGEAKYLFPSFCLRIRSKSEQYPNQLLALLFYSNLIQKQIERSARVNTVRPNTTKPAVQNTLLPIVSEEHKKEIVGTIDRMATLRDKSTRLYRQAENLLLEELGLKDFKLKEELTYKTLHSKIDSARRIDAEYFQPKYKRLWRHLEKNFDAVPLKKLLREEMRKGTEPGSDHYQDEGIPFVRVGNLTIRGFESGDREYLSWGLYEELKQEYQPRKGEVLLTKDAAPGTAYVLKKKPKVIICSGILRVKLKEEVKPEYFALIVNSLVGKQKTEQDAGGSVIRHWREDQIEEMLIPVLPAKTQQKIADLISESHKARSKAKQLLEEAKTKVEEMIESKIEENHE